MRLLVIGAGMMGSAAAYDMARSPAGEAVTLADIDKKRAKDAARRVNKLTGGSKVEFAQLDAASRRAAGKLMKEHDAALSCVPYFHNFELAKAALKTGCHFADLGGNNGIVRQELGLDKQAAQRQVRIAPDCGLSPGLASILAGELLRRVGGRADALKIYVGGLPQQPRPPFRYQLVFSIEGLINEYAEPAKILRNRKVASIEPLSEVESFQLPGLPELEAFHTSGGTSTLPESFAGRVGECFEKTLRYPGHAAMVRTLYAFGLFSQEPRKVGKAKIVPRELMAQLMLERFAGNEPDMVIMRVEAVAGERVESFTLVDRSDPKTRLSAMMRTTAWPASIVTQMLASGAIEKHGAILQETDIPADRFLAELEARGISVLHDSTGAQAEQAAARGRD